MKLHTSLGIALAAILFSACQHDCVSPEPEPSHLAIQFDHLAVGQKSRYQGLEGSEYYANNTDVFSYTDDTLQLEIIAQDANGFLVEETLHYVGALHPILAYDKDSVYHYYLYVAGDTLRFKPATGTYVNARIVGYLTAKNGLPLSDFASPKIELTGWKTSLPYCECRRTGYAENYTLFGQHYPRLNVIVENSPMSFDGNGETMVYAKTNGIVRFSTYSWWTQSGIGWDLIP